MKKNSQDVFNPNQRTGEDITKGALVVLLSTTIKIAGIILLFTFCRNLFGLGVDSTDASTWNRSGLRVYTDNEYGVQYVGTSAGLIVRVDVNGNPVVVSRPLD